MSRKIKLNSDRAQQIFDRLVDVRKQSMKSGYEDAVDTLIRYLEKDADFSRLNYELRRAYIRELVEQTIQEKDSVTMEHLLMTLGVIDSYGSNTIIDRCRRFAKAYKDNVSLHIEPWMTRMDISSGDLYRYHCGLLARIATRTDAKMAETGRLGLMDELLARPQGSPTPRISTPSLITEYEGIKDGGEARFRAQAQRVIDESKNPDLDLDSIADEYEKVFDLILLDSLPDHAVDKIRELHGTEVADDAAEDAVNEQIIRIVAEYGPPFEELQQMAYDLTAKMIKKYRVIRD